MEFEAEVAISNSHIHLTMHDMEELDIEELEPVKELDQIPNYVSNIKLKVKGKEIKVIGPCRFYSQLELTQRDAYKLGVKAPIRLSGRTWDCPKVKVSFGSKSIKIPAAVMKRHLHISPELAAQFGLKHKDTVMAYVNKGFRQGIIGNIEVFVEKNNELKLHIDRDEASAFDLNNGDVVIIRKDEQKMFEQLDGYQEMDKYITNV